MHFWYLEMWPVYILFRLFICDWRWDRAIIGSGLWLAMGVDLPFRQWSVTVDTAQWNTQPGDGGLIDSLGSTITLRGTVGDLEQVQKIIGLQYWKNSATILIPLRTLTTSWREGGGGNNSKFKKIIQIKGQLLKRGYSYCICIDMLYL